MQKGKDIFGKRFFLHLGLFGAALMVGDCMITPAISVLSAVEGIEIATPAFSHFVLPITFLILIVLFSFQKKGTAKIGVYFGPIMMIWFAVIGLLGAHSIIYSPEIISAINPYYGLLFCITNPGLAFLASGAIFLVVTGGEALYSDMGHLSRKSISLGWFYVALPCLLLNYYGQGAFLLRSPEGVTNPFYLMAPEWSLIPLVSIATMATVIASQAVISGFFSLASQCVQLGYSPRLNIVHTSEKSRGQIYVPSVNWICLIGTIWLVIEFKTSSSLAAAYGISVSLTMGITTILTAIVAKNIWKWSWFRVVSLFSLFFIVDVVFMSANLLKIEDGGWIPLTIAVIIFTMVTTWKKGRAVLYERLRASSHSFQRLLDDIKISKPIKVPGTAVFMIGDTNLTPPTLLHNLKHNKVIHETMIFLTIITESVAFISEANRVQISKMSDGFYRITGHFGFKETPNVIN
ncbi:MAG: KUP/HAK/KT family potassium transporter, partial [Bdellovibrionales bacterium]